MRSISNILCLLAFLLFTSFTTDRACEYVGSNIEFIETQTKKALSEQDLNKAKFQVYKAINAIEKTREKLKDCGCSYASKNLFDGLDNLIKATKTSTIKAAHLLIERALVNTESSLESLHEHYTHQGNYQADLLTLNIKTSDEEKLSNKITTDRELRQKIDISLEKFEKSLNLVVESVDCKEATKFTTDIYKKCEQALLKDDLTEGKKYYNLRTKAIASAALKKLEGCK